MGTQLSKIGHVEKKVGPCEAQLPSTPILTPKTKFFDWDPRSPSANIVRTPIQVIKVINNFQADSPAIGEINTSCVDLDESCELCATYDPRSPSVEFTRTPIVLDKQPVKLRNKALDNVRKQMIETTPFKNVTPPRLLESNSIKRTVSHKEKRNSTIGLLQTNLDYIETDLDSVKYDGSFKRALSRSEEILSTSQPDQPETNEKLPTPEKPDEESSKSIPEDLPVEHFPVIKDVTIKRLAFDEQLLESDEQLLESDEQLLESDEQLIESDDQLLSSNEHSDDTKNQRIVETILPENLKNDSKNIIEEIDEEVKNLPYEDLCKSLEENSYKIEINQTRNKIDPQNLVTEFDKKITNLIYEDTVPVSTPTKLNIPKESGRTPLGDRNCNDNVRTKSKNKLKVHDKPSKNDYAVSKIPVFKTKKSGFVQCENTPPNVKPNERLKKSMWDAEKTLII